MEVSGETRDVAIPRAWLKTLMQYAARVNGQDEFQRKIAISALLGYISSAETILKYK